MQTCSPAIICQSHNEYFLSFLFLFAFFKIIYKLWKHGKYEQAIYSRDRSVPTEAESGIYVQLCINEKERCMCLLFGKDLKCTFKHARQLLTQNSIFSPILQSKNTSVTTIHSRHLHSSSFYSSNSSGEEVTVEWCSICGSIWQTS